MVDSNPEAEVVKREELYNGKIVRLHVDTIRQASGNTSIREVVSHPGGVLAVPVLNDGRLVLVRQFRYPLQKYILEFPAGKLDSHLSPQETIALELEEEVGYHARLLTHECSFYTSPGISNELLHLFLARDLQSVPQRLEEGEHISVECYSLDDCLAQALRGEITDGKTLLGLFWYQFKFKPVGGGPKAHA
jgi:ADP-ribose pyrophosphatase